MPPFLMSQAVLPYERQQRHRHVPHQRGPPWGPTLRPATSGHRANPGAAGGAAIRVAKVIAFLASEESGFIRGEVLPVTGG